MLCGQDLHDTKHDEVLTQKEALLLSAQEDIAQTQKELEKNKNSLFDLGLEPKLITQLKQKHLNIILN